MNFNDETLYMGNENNVPNQPLPNNIGYDNTPANDKKNNNMGVKIGATVAGSVVAGTGAALAYVHYHGQNDDNSSNAINDLANVAQIDNAGQNNEMHQATGVNDSMSYAEAFSTARAEVGPGGYFVWHGGVYGTYSQTEWNAMTPAQQAEFTHHAMGDYGYSANVNDNHVAQNHNTAQHNNDIIADNHNDVEADSLSDHLAENHTAQPGFYGAKDTGDAYPDYVNDAGDNGVHIIGTQDVVTDDGTIMTVGAAQVDGTDVMLVDVDYDGTFDVMLADVNADGEISDNEIMELDSPIHVEDFQATMELGEGGEADAIDATYDYKDIDPDDNTDVFMVDDIDNVEDNDVIEIATVDTDTDSIDDVLDADVVEVADDDYGYDSNDLAYDSADAYDVDFASDNQEFGTTTDDLDFSQDDMTYDC